MAIFDTVKMNMEEQNCYERLNDLQQTAYRLYKTNGDFEKSSNFAETLNTMLRNNSVDQDWQQWVDILDSVVRSNQLLTTMTFYRATSNDFIEKQKVDGFIIDPGFLSTASQESAVLRHFPDTLKHQPAVLSISCPVGTHAIPMDQLPNGSHSELEWLFPRNSRLKIEDISIVTDKNALARFFGMRWALHMDDVQELYYYHTALIIN